MKPQIIKYTNRYIIHIQFLGFRYHGWAKQTGLLTVHEMVDKSSRFVLGHENFRTIGCSRTDAKVSALHYTFELMTNEELNTVSLLDLYNKNFPPDIRAFKVEIPEASFNIIKSAKIKEYVYLFAHGSKPHPFSAPYLTTLPETLDIELMKRGALLFEGMHNFRRYCTQPGPDTVVKRSVEVSRIEENHLFYTDFFEGPTYAYHVHAAGFMRNQARLMMGRLFALGKGIISLEDIEISLAEDAEGAFDTIAPASGLILNKVTFKDAGTHG